jgi:hypothetical protein
MTRQSDRWAGTIEDIERATRLAIDVLSQRTRTEQPCHIQIVLPGRVTDADTPDALRTEIDTRDLTLIRTIRIEVGAKRGTRATIHVERQPPAMTIEVTGDDRTRVEGLISQLDELLRRGRQRLTVNNIGGLLVLSALVVVFGGGMLIQVVEGNPASLSRTATAFLVVVILVAVAMVPAGLWLFPGLELLGPGNQTRARRFRFGIVAFVISIASSLGAALIYDLVK